MDFWEKIRDVPVKDLIFLDEAGVNLALVRLYARALRGQRARGTRPQKRGKNVSMIGARALSGIVASINLSGSIDKLTFEAFVIRKLVPNLWEGATQSLSAQDATSVACGFAAAFGIIAVFIKEKKLKKRSPRLELD